MEKRARRTFTQEFKVQAMELAEQMGSINKAADKLGIKADSIRLWRRSLGRNLGIDSRSVAQAMSETEEIKKLKKQISELEKTNYILKKAAAFFSQDHLK
jgi:transposase